MKSDYTNYSFFFALLLLLTGCSTTTIYLVRHAEKAQVPANDPPLSTQGQQRAQVLADSLRNKNIGVIYSTNTLRTRSTAEPLARELSLPIRPYSPDTLREMARYLKSPKAGNALVIGHSNTILPLLDQFPALHKEKAIPDSDYDNLYRVKVQKRFLRPQRITLTEGTYGTKTE
ncbi:phosphoglycerate mutase family protein [Telluribacter sp.]|jgi:phosphohistidine phosphatase SixA|uniref:SixA phosphatase family protein n=1 Tax=Telluribacter sp. TaxID=1978767 RepID=UPI002E146A94|nr:phosphoglycerate mutase family protein [Telluribacter sp.]